LKQQYWSREGCMTWPARVSTRRNFIHIPASGWTCLVTRVFYGLFNNALSNIWHMYVGSSNINRTFYVTFINHKLFLKRKTCFIYILPAPLFTITIGRAYAPLKQSLLLLTQPLLHRKCNFIVSPKFFSF
jgi:hypothetical protein